MALPTASVRPFAPSLATMEATWNFGVLGVMSSCRAMALLDCAREADQHLQLARGELDRGSFLDVISRPVCASAPSPR
jgi:hypothetical protein